MVRFTSRLVLLMLLARLAVGSAAAQGPVEGAPPFAGGAEPTARATELPRPPDQPRSLFQPATEPSIYCCPEGERPYFQPDPRLDPAELPHPGWLCDVELDALGCSVVQSVGQFANPAPVAVPFNVAVPMAPLQWTASPRVELGHRLPAGFGEIDVAYRFVQAQGTGNMPLDPLAAPDGPASLVSRFTLHVVDLDYASRETSLGPDWDMKWRLGLRYVNLEFDSRADESLAAAAAGSGFYERSITNFAWGIGPHAGLELKRRCGATGLALVGHLDGGLVFGEVDQGFKQLSVAAGGNGSYGFCNYQQLPMLDGILGVDWRPAAWPQADVLLGYRGEYWWNAGRLSDPDLYNGQSAGEIGMHGVTLRLELNY